MKRQRLLLKLLFHLVFWPVGIGLSLAVTWDRYQGQILLLAVEELAQYTGLPLHAREASLAVWDSFPEAELNLKGVYLMEGDSTGHADTLFFSGSLRLNLNLRKIWKRQYEVEKLAFEDTRLYLRWNQKGELSLTEVLQNRDSSSRDSSALAFNLKSVEVKNSVLHFEDRQRGQKAKIALRSWKGSLRYSDSLVYVEQVLRAYVEKLQGTEADFLAFKALMLKGALEIEPQKQQLQFPDLQAYINGVPLKAEGRLAWAGGQPAIRVKLQSKQSRLVNLQALVPQSVARQLKAYHSEGLLSLVVDYDLLPSGAYRLSGQVLAEEGRLDHPDMDIHLDSLSGHLNFERNYQGQVQLDLPSLDARLNGKPLHLGLNYQNQKLPQGMLSVDLELRGSELLSFLPDTLGIETLKGEMQATADLSFNYDEQGFRMQDGHGELRLQRGEIRWTRPHLHLQEMEAELLYSRGSLAINHLRCTSEGQPYALKGFLAPDWEKKHLEANLNLNTGDLNLKDWQMFWAKDSVQKEEPREESSPNSSSEAEWGYTVDLDTRCRSLAWDSIRLDQWQGQLKWEEQHLRVEEARFRLAGAWVDLEGQHALRQEQDDYTQLHAELDGLELPVLLQTFGNFGQQELTHEQVGGTVYGPVDVLLYWGPGYTLQRNKLLAEADWAIVDGALKGYEPALALARFLDESALRDLRFDTLRNRLHLHGDTLFIPQMEIRSNALDLELSGWYSFEQELNLHLAIPLDNWQKEDKDSRFGRVEAVEKEGKVYLSISGSTGTPKIEMDKARAMEGFKQTWKREKKEFRDLFRRSGK